MQLSDFRKKLGAIKSPPGAVGTLGWSAQCVAWLAGREPRTDRPLPSLRIADRHAQADASPPRRVVPRAALTARFAAVLRRGTAARRSGSGDAASPVAHRIRPHADRCAGRAAPQQELPPDDTGHGFDNLGDVLSLSPLHLQMYQRAAETIAADVTRPDGAPLSRDIALGELSHSEYVIPAATS